MNTYSTFWNHYKCLNQNMVRFSTIYTKEFILHFWPFWLFFEKNSKIPKNHDFGLKLISKREMIIKTTQTSWSKCYRLIRRWPFEWDTLELLNRLYKRCEVKSIAFATTFNHTKTPTWNVSGLSSHRELASGVSNSCLYKSVCLYMVILVRITRFEYLFHVLKSL